MPDPDCPQKMPYVLQVEPGTYAWCRCGKSATQPYCDGSHADTEFRPEVVKIEEARNVAWCGCKRSGNGAMCDGTHASL